MYGAVRYDRYGRVKGLGQSASQIGSSAASIGGSAATVPIAGAVGVAVPIVGAAIAGVTLAITALIQNSGCGVTCVEASQWANQAEPLLNQNITAYFSQPAPRSQSSQAAALANFDAVWAKLQQLCGQPGTGNAGVRCISDRQSGACTWKQSSTSSLLAFPGEPQPGACWNWFSGYRDPIANDPDVVSDAQAASSSATSALSTIAPSLSSIPTWAWLAAAALGIWVLAS
jgi:hypothetical protein